MATYSASYSTGAVTSDAEFRTRGKWFSDQLTAGGWTKTADTGQIDWTTVTKAAGVSTSQGYEIRTSTDALTAIYVKIEYGSNATSANQLGFWITTGTGSNGTGTLTGQVGARTQIASATSTAANVDYVSATTSRFSIAHYVPTTAASSSLAFLVQRTTDATGADTSTGFICLIESATSAKNQYTSFAGGASTQRGNIGWMLYGTTPVPGSAGAIPVFPFYVAGPSDFTLIRDAVAIPTTYAGGQSMHTLSILGSNRTYVGTFGNSTTGFYDGTGSATINLTFCMRYE